jgi:ankyrin repeat protein
MDIKIAKLLLDNGDEINVKDNSGKTPVDKAHDYDREKVMNFLIEKGGKMGFEK